MPQSWGQLAVYSGVAPGTGEARLQVAWFLPLTQPALLSWADGRDHILGSHTTETEDKREAGAGAGCIREKQGTALGVGDSSVHTPQQAARELRPAFLQPPTCLTIEPALLQLSLRTPSISRNSHQHPRAL